jgi:hypothetical protein
MSEYILVYQGYCHYLSLDTPDCILGISNTILFAATISEWKIWQCSRTGWFQTNPECEAHHMALKNCTSSLQGSEKEKFNGLLYVIYDLLAMLPVC